MSPILIGWIISILGFKFCIFIRVGWLNGRQSICSVFINKILSCLTKLQPVLSFTLLFGRHTFADLQANSFSQLTYVYSTQSITQYSNELHTKFKKSKWEQSYLVFYLLQKTKKKKIFLENLLFAVLHWYHLGCYIFIMFKCICTTNAT